MKYDTIVLRQIYKYTQKELSEKFDIPLSTIKNWDSRHCMPYYVWKMMSQILSSECSSRS